MVSSKRLTVFALVATAVLWASAFPAIKTALMGYDARALSFLRLFVASLVLGIAAPILGVRIPRRRDLALIAVCGVTGMSAYQLLLNSGERQVPAGTASLLIGVAPVFSVLLGAYFLGEKLSARIVVGSAAALAGCAVIALSSGHVGYTGAAWVVLGAAAVQGTYHAASKPLLARYSALEVACYAMWSGTVFLLPLAPNSVRQIGAAPWSATASVVFLGALPSAAGFVAWGYAISRSTVSAATSALYSVPVIALGVSFVWLGEVPSVIEIAGGVVSLGGVALIRRRRPLRGRGHKGAIAGSGDPLIGAPLAPAQE